MKRGVEGSNEERGMEGGRELIVDHPCEEGLGISMNMCSPDGCIIL